MEQAAMASSAGEASAFRAPGVAALAARLPAALGPLAELAFDVRWLFDPRVRRLFESVDASLLSECHGNPVDLLLEAAPAVLGRCATDVAFLERMRAVMGLRAVDLARPYAPASPASGGAPVAFMCSEFALHAALPIYSGGLGVLAGDYLKEATDRALPVVGVGLLYRRGYFHQRLDVTGWQHEYWIDARRSHLPIEAMLASDGAPLEVRIPATDRDIVARVYRVAVGRVPLYLLDTDVAENSAMDRWITAQLYVGDRQIRLLQYLVLGVGGVRALRALGIAPSVFHLNEGHPVFSALELAREHVECGSTFEEAWSAVRRALVFTTHTPVAAGNESYSEAELEPVLGAFVGSLGVPFRQLIALGHTGLEDGSLTFGLTPFALRAARAANAVSRRHGEVARAMWSSLYGNPAPMPIQHVTNGVHIPTWMSEPMTELLARYLGTDFQLRAADPQTWTAVQNIPDEELWAVRCGLRRSLVDYVRTRSVEDRLARGDALDYVVAAARSFDADVLTVGFARRVASYKRLQLLTQDIARSLALLSGPRPIQVVIAGKAHPRDDDGKRIVQLVFGIRAAQVVGARVAFLEDYDMAMAARLVAGCDVWVNLPRPPLEASGTSGMKAAFNGGLHLSVLDGWWHEAWDGHNGWAIHSEPGPDEGVQDARDADQLYDTLEREVVPLFHARDAGGIPRGWVAKIKASLMTLGPRFGSGRMLGDYLTHQYLSP